MIRTHSPILVCFFFCCRVSLNPSTHGNCKFNSFWAKSICRSFNLPPSCIKMPSSQINRRLLLILSHNGSHSSSSKVSLDFSTLSTHQLSSLETIADLRSFRTFSRNFVGPRNVSLQVGRELLATDDLTGYSTVVIKEQRTDSTYFSGNMANRYMTTYDSNAVWIINVVHFFVAAKPLADRSFPYVLVNVISSNFGLNNVDIFVHSHFHDQQYT